MRENLVSAPDHFVLSSLKDGHDPFRGRIREGVRTRLLAAQVRLPAGLCISWVEGHRDPRLQEQYFNNYRERLASLDQSLSDEDLYRRASRYISPPEVAPHVAGAAVDLTLHDADGAELPMGSEVNAAPEESDGACYTAAPGTAEAGPTGAPGGVLTAVGLVNYPTEWWHWSYGDRYWALTTGASAAIYGPRV